MPKKPVPKLPYDVSWILQRFRALLLGREHNTALRWAKDMAPRTQPLPELPLGPSSKIRFNYYCDRDPRSEVKFPQVLYDGETQGKKLLRTSESAGCRPLEKGEQEENVTSKKADDKEEKEASKKKEGKDQNEETKKDGDQKTTKKAGEEEQEKSKKEEGKEEKEAIKKGGEKETTKKAGEKEENVTTKKEDEKDGNEASKEAGEEREKVTSKNEGGKDETVASKKAGEKEENVPSKEGEKGEKETTKKAEEKMTSNKDEEKEVKEASKKEGGNKEENEASTKKVETEEIDLSNPVNRVPGKVWHWDTFGGQPEQDWAKQDGQAKSKN